MKKIPFCLMKTINSLLGLLPFLVCWFLYYEPRTLAVGSKKVSVLVILAFLTIFYVFSVKLDCYRVSVLQIRDIIFGQILAAMIADVCLYVIIWMLSIHLPSLLPGLLAFGGQCVMGIIWAVVMHKVYFAGHEPLKTVVIYDERVGIEQLIQHYRLEKRFKVTGVYAIEDMIDRMECLNGMDAVFLSGVDASRQSDFLQYCTQHDIRLFLIPGISDVILRGSEPSHIMHLPVLESRGYRPNQGYLITKRLIDIAVSAIALVVLSPVFLIVIIAIRSDGGPALYRQRRLTKDGKVFEILKFRSMIVDAEKYSGAVLSAGENDPRITKVGRFIRACRLDELPQLWNIFCGDMSLVGPRPERPELQTVIEQEVPAFGLRLQAKAGLTGYAQVYGKYNTTFYDKLLMDLLYISRPSILEDIVIMLATVKILFSKDSTEGVEENLFAVAPISRFGVEKQG